MRIHVCGARGSTPAPGPNFLRYGGNTSCLALSHDGAVPTLLVDAGTGIREVTSLLHDRPFDGSLILSHLHWDHTQGLPFFEAGDVDGSRVDVFLPEQGDSEAVFERSMSPPHFPITPASLRGRWRFSGLDAGEHQIEGFSVLAADIPHEGGRTFGYRISDGRSTVAYLSDHCPISLGPGPDGLGTYHEAALELVRDCDVIFHDAEYTDEELSKNANFGHSSVGYAVRLAEAGGVRKLLLFHLHPSRTDSEIASIVRAYQSQQVTVSAAEEGMVIDLP
jgi:phosphoribosyl 1,2-cyclic phosphodiesterase